MDVLFVMSFSLHFKLLWPLHYHFSCDLCASEQCSSLWWLHWLLPLWVNKHWVSMMLFFNHSWYQGIQWGVLLAPPLYHSNNNLSPKCLLGHMQTMPWVLHMVSFLFKELKLPLIHYIIFWYLVMVLAFCFNIPMWLPCSSIGAQPLGFATL